MEVRRGQDGGKYITILLLLLGVIPGNHVSCIEDLPEKIMVECGTEKCNILEQFCTLNGRCDYCNEDECKLPIAPGERPLQCFFKCNHVMEKLKNYSSGYYPNWIVYLLGPYAALVTLLLALLCWKTRTTATKCCCRREIQTPSEEQDLVSQPVAENNESPPAAQGSSRRSPVITSPQNDRECENAITSSQ
ncbi:hypothetical protein KP79_PYT11458 [Mizuhopecten yessoensis]|uniref:Uncharacterized protein n=2 Tax=Mizuhopecten yessoensis TaxID=6573 RepID=A0A210PDV9_MIZYE|nr:hypothetical protein KP79_PYT11458 [Mizuhopecten yessoensis]